MSIDLQKYSKGLLDFHTHSTESDGGDTPTELVERGKNHGVTAMALTDHYQSSGLPEFKSACEKYDIFTIPFGTESCVELPIEILQKGDPENHDIVILGKNPRNEQKEMGKYHTFMEKIYRESLVPQKISKLKKIGFSFPEMNLEERSVKEWCAFVEDLKTIITKGDNLEVLINHIQMANSEITEKQIRENPIRYPNKFVFSIGQPGYVKELENFSVKDAINLAESMNCKAFIAHPGGEFGYLSDPILNYMIEQGIHGIETRNYFNSPEQNDKFDALAKEHNLIRSGGSDCHGNKGPFKIGIYDRPQNQVQKNVLEELMDRLPS